MTYRQVLEEFDEKFAWAIWEKADEELFDGYKGVKSFLKQSFIKYLQGEVERLEKTKKNFDRKAVLLQKKSNRTTREDMLFTRWTSHASSLGRQITHINNQIKEIEA